MYVPLKKKIVYLYMYPYNNGQQYKYPHNLSIFMAYLIKID